MKELEDTKGILIYHMIKTNTEFGTLNNFLYISAHKEEWEYSRECLQSGNVCAYVHNEDDDQLSEFGNIGIKYANGGLIRTY